MWSIAYQQKCQRISVGKENTFQQIILDYLDTPIFLKKKKKPLNILHIILKINLRWLINLNIKAEIMKLIKAYIETYFHHLRVAKMCEI